jgi:hypothetical protein
MKHWPLFFQPPKSLRRKGGNEDFGSPSRQKGSGYRAIGTASS